MLACRASYDKKALARQVIPLALGCRISLSSRPDYESRGGSRISKGGVDGRPYLLRGARENALTKKIGNNFSCTCLRRVF